MAEASRRVLIIEHNADLAEFFRQMLDEDGYDVEWRLHSPGTVDAAARFAPDLIVIDLQPAFPSEERLVNRLRMTRSTAGIPVLVVTASRVIAETAMASSNLTQALVEPFELDEFLVAVRRGLHQETPLATFAPQLDLSALAMAERILAEDSREAIFRWMRQLWTEEPWVGRFDLRLSDMLDVMPRLVSSVVAAIRVDGGDKSTRVNTELLEHARVHARLRFQQGVSLTPVIREYTVMRNELWRILGNGLPKELRTEEMLRLQAAINSTVDRIIEETVPGYGSAQNEQAA